MLFQYNSMTLPMQRLPQRDWEMFVVFKNPKTGEYRSHKFVRKTLGEMNRVRSKVLESVRTR